MRSLRVLALMRAISSLSSGLPGTMARLPLLSSLVANSGTSNRSPALRSFSSGPWQTKQLADRIGRICLAYWTLADAAFACASGSARLLHAVTKTANSPEKRRKRFMALGSRDRGRTILGRHCHYAIYGGE